MEVDCDTLELADEDTCEDKDTRALPDDNEERDDEPELLLLLLLVNDFNTVFERDEEAVTLREGTEDTENFAVSELEADNRLLPLREDDFELVLEITLDMVG